MGTFKLFTISSIQINHILVKISSEVDTQTSPIMKVNEAGYKPIKIAQKLLHSICTLSGALYHMLGEKK